MLNIIDTTQEIRYLVENTSGDIQAHLGEIMNDSYKVYNTLQEVDLASLKIMHGINIKGSKGEFFVTRLYLGMSQRINIDLIPGMIKLLEDKYPECFI